MRKVLMCLIAVCLYPGVVIAADSPIDKGSAILKGGFNFASTSGDIVDNETRTEVAIQPALGVFVFPGFIVGGELLFQSITWGESSMRTVGIGPFVGYYFDTSPKQTTIKGKTYPYIMGQFIYTNQSSDGGDDLIIKAFGAKVGMAFMISETVSLDSGVGITSQSSSYLGASESGITLSVQAGVTAFIW